MPLHDYRITQKIATGSFGVVYRVTRQRDGADLALKRIPLGSLSEQQRREAAGEVRVMYQLHHPCLVAARDAFIFNDTSICLVMDHYGGGDLSQLIAKQREKDEYFRLDELMPWLVQMLLAVEYMHSEGFVHRDLKTQNIFLENDLRRIAVGDFGIAQEAAASAHAPLWSTQLLRQDSFPAAVALPDVNSVTRAPLGVIPPDMIKGTPLYMAPEVLHGGSGGRAADVWSLGCIFFETLSLCHPFDSRDVAALMLRVINGEREALPAHYPLEVRDAVERMLALDSRHRPSCAELLQLPCVQGYVHRWWAAQAAAMATDAAGAAAAALRTQLARLGVHLKSPLQHAAPRPATSLPPDPPSVVREAAERRRAAAAAAAAACSQSSLHPQMLQEDGTVGTFFYAGQSVNLLDSQLLHGDAPRPVHHALNTQPAGSLLYAADRSPLNYLATEQMADVAAADAGDDGAEPRSATPLRASAAHEPATFYEPHTNVADMRNVPTEVIAREVGRLRTLLQRTLRTDQHRRDQQAFAQRYGLNALTAVHGGQRRTPLMQRYALTAVDAPTALTADPPVARSGSRRAADVVQTADGDARPVGLGGGVSPRKGGAAGQPAALEADVAETSQLAAAPGGRYARRRAQLMAEVLAVLDARVFKAVYRYYEQHDVSSRDPAVVMGWLPDRAQWRVLPLIEEVRVLDQLLIGTHTRGGVERPQ